jgi:hypothetical protein
LLFRRSQHRQSICAGQPEIGDHQIERPLTNGVDPLRPGCRRQDVMANRFQRIDHRKPHQRLIINEQNLQPLHDTLSNNERSLETGR